MCALVDDDVGVDAVGDVTLLDAAEDDVWWLFNDLRVAGGDLL